MNESHADPTKDPESKPDAKDDLKTPCRWPADARLLEGEPVEVDQSALTGESLPATRKSGEAVFSGSIIRRGEIGALVYATRAHTYYEDFF